MGVVNKQRLVKKIIARLTGELELYAKAAHAAHAEATHEQSKAENKNDTRGWKLLIWRADNRVRPRRPGRPSNNLPR